MGHFYVFATALTVAATWSAPWAFLPLAIGVFLLAATAE